jgi:ABC-type amino acid transport substrate-binding protein
LWRQIAANLGLEYEIREYALEGLISAVRDHEVDVGVGAITINAARESVMDFSHSIYSTGLGIAVKPASSSGIRSTFRGLLSWAFAKVIAGLLLLLALMGGLVWISERRKNPGQFGGGPLHGIAAGLWWSAVTMTTVGYGDKAPVTLIGRMLALAWMFTAIIVFSFFTASITSTLTVKQLASSIRGADDLPGKRVASMGGSTSATYLERRGIAFRSVATVKEGIEAVAAGDVDAMVYDAPLLRYVAKHAGRDVVVLSRTFKRQEYGFALPEGSPLREPINRALLAEMTTDRWRALVAYYIGEVD